MSTTTVSPRALETEMLPFIDLKTQYAELREAINARIQRVLDHGQYIMGPEVDEVEERLATLTGSKHCVTVASGTDALLVALMALGLQPGDEVITTPFTFAATAEMIALIGGRPVFVDIDPETCNIDASQIEARVTARTKAIMPVGLYGQPADMDEINAVGVRHGIPVVEDAAQSFGALYKGRMSGRLAAVGCTSFFPSKPLGCYGDGGALFTDDAELAEAFRELRVHGQPKRYVHTRIGICSRMDTIQCAVILAKLDRFEREIERRVELGARYNALMDTIGASRVRQRDDRTSVFAQYTVFVEHRDEVQKAMQAMGVPTAVHYPVPLNEQPAYAGFDDTRTPHAERAGRQVISLPMSADLTERQQDRIVAAFAQATGRKAA